MNTYLIRITAPNGQHLHMTVLASSRADAFTQVLRELEAPAPENPPARDGCTRPAGEAA
ncbi:MULTISPECIES: hypothetical protein [Ralstonia solanacearum species complex]|uniref:Uncharacterized protein n=1 Tax=Ralstonia nicotianae TaxID=3037696 RepID=A0ABX7ZQU9_9RALS|nr:MULTISPECIES: hypothetical protein [Ralstonia solanacearum species complex]BCL91365.1 hypothetical protein MAFF211479_10660 [Ralstonia solanacearum]MDC6294008.1 hypothetical protein [Ralstonia pseudosolanacearum]MDD7788905.1 hypothetical protein [Ralstonia pseudosolanacearum]MDN3367853.1 hypothetical protein [Ralstonia pseudosolanacearum]QOK87760.1 hypothetical protein HF907_14610 [Ralstonia pseudosolanacearum]